MIAGVFAHNSLSNSCCGSRCDGVLEQIWLRWVFAHCNANCHPHRINVSRIVLRNELCCSALRELCAYPVVCPTQCAGEIEMCVACAERERGGREPRLRAYGKKAMCACVCVCVRVHKERLALCFMLPTCRTQSMDEQICSRFQLGSGVPVCGCNTYLCVARSWMQICMAHSFASLAHVFFVLHAFGCIHAWRTRSRRSLVHCLWALQHGLAGATPS